MPASKDTVAPPFAGDQEGGQDETVPVVDDLPEFSSTMERLCILLLSVLAVFVPAYIIKTVPTTLISEFIVGLTFALPTTVLVWKADESAHTKRFWGEILLFLFCILMSNTQFLGLISYAHGPRFVGTFTFAWSITIPLVLLRDNTPGDKRNRRRRIMLVVLAWGHFVTHTAGDMTYFFGVYMQDLEKNPFINRITLLLWVCFTLFVSAGFLSAMLHRDRKEHIEHSVPYAAAYSWTLNLTIMGSSFLLGIVSRMDFTSLGGVLLRQVVLSTYNTLTLWMFSRISSRIWTVREEILYMLPGFFATVVRLCHY
jgi:hypothetical protein